MQVPAKISVFIWFHFNLSQGLTADRHQSLNDDYDRWTKQRIHNGGNEAENNRQKIASGSKQAGDRSNFPVQKARCDLTGKHYYK